MADISDVEATLLSLLTQTAYPNGTGNPSAVLDSNGTPHAVQLYRGWPVPDQLDTDMAGGTVDVSIFPTRVEINATRYTKDYRPLPLPAPTLTLNVIGDTVTVGGTVAVPQNVGLIVRTAGGRVSIGDIALEGGTGDIDEEGDVPIELESATLQTVCRFGFSYAVQSNDTLTTIAAALAALVNAETPATSSGPVFTIPDAVVVIPRVGVVGTAVQETKRQRRNVMVSVWCPSPDLRDNAAKLLDAALSQNEFLVMPDGTACRLVYVSSPVTDSVQKENVYRRDLIYSAEYGTTVSINAPTITIIEVNLDGGPVGDLGQEGNAGKIEQEDDLSIELETSVIETIYL